MKNLTLSVLLILIFELLLSKCANPKAPTGGPKDTIPPNLIETFPPSESLNTNEREITLVFDEWVNAEKITSNLIITPNIEIKYKSITRKNQLVLKFEEAFPDSTTITFNFFDGVTDANEKTPVVNLTYVFSTGDFLDSLKVSGVLNNLLTGTPREKTIVGLFTHTDTLDIFTMKPTYFTSSNDKGEFEIRNIKSGTYRLVAFDDQNRNLLFEASQEAYGFLSDLIVLDTNVHNLVVPIVQQDASEFKFINTRTLGSNFDIQYSKSLASASLSVNMAYRLSDDFKTLRIYQPDDFNINDSLQAIIHSADSIGNEGIDTLFIKFNENKRTAEPFNLEIAPSGNKIIPVQDYTLMFNKPVKTFDSALIYYAKDSSLTYPLDSLIDFHWNETKDQLKFTSSFDTTHYFNEQKRAIAAADTFNVVTTTIALEPDTASRQRALPLPTMSNSIYLKFPEGTFISIEKDTLKEVVKTFSFIKQPEVATIILTITTEKPSYTVQLINPSYNVLKEFPANPEIRIENLQPGKYGIRILIDDNQDGKWSIGNILKYIEPESVFILDSFTTLRENWENPIIITF